MLIREFPDDDSLWLLKWIDGFVLPHRGTRSTAIQVWLQRLPFKDPRELSRLDPSEVADLLGYDSKKAGAVQGGAGDRYSLSRVHIGTLPLLSLGQVYSRRQHVGELPASLMEIALPEAEGSCDSWRIGDELPKPSQWRQDLSFKLLHRKEYDGLIPKFARSRCLVFPDPKSGITFVIPRTVIFKRFYATQSDIARALSPGPWSTTRSRVVCEADLDSGLKTKVDPETGDWHIILQTHVRDPHYLLLALLYFDDYAFQCAESIYTEALLEAKQTGGTWYASARLPFKADTPPLNLHVKGFRLNPRLCWDESTGKKNLVRETFLVTAIPRASWPKYVPPVAYERRNSGKTAPIVQEIDTPPPYSGGRGEDNPIEPGAHTIIGSDTDSSSEHNSYNEAQDTVDWIDKPAERKIPKEKSKTYTGEHPPPREKGEATEDASSGEQTGEEGNPSQIRAEQLTRPPVDRYSLLMEAIGELVNEAKLDSFHVVQPIESFQCELRGGVPCWNFITHEEGRTGDWPKSGWRMLKRQRRRDIGIPRSVLVLRIERNEKVGFWFEVEGRKSESGMASPFAFGTVRDVFDIADSVIQVIAESEGASLRRALAESFVAQGMGQIAWYTHVYGDQHASIDSDSIIRFLERNGW